MVCKGFNGSTISTMCILLPKFKQLGVILGLLVLEEEDNFCLISILVAVAMVEKLTYKKRKRNSCSTDY
jgi:hypothetical protein